MVTDSHAAALSGKDHLLPIARFACWDY